MLSKNIALVTGASAGFGKAIALQLVQDGYKVIASARREDKLKNLASLYPEDIFPLKLDVSKPLTLQETLDSLPENFQTIDVLINNAGLALGIKPVPHIDLNDWDQMIDTNIRGLIHLTQFIVKGMIERKKGHIVSLSSIAGTYPYLGGNVYGASKAFVTQFMLNLKVDLLKTPIKLTTIEPGLTSGTEFSEVRLKDKEQAQAVYANVDALTAEDIAKTVSWILGLPDHVNINRIEMMPVCQAPGGLTVSKTTD
ncbi:NADP-dependent 3-hydroxy acid dehydrogenase YdfG [Commensalibacter sp. Nvir]|uniref:SDR family NAD(P)-dependent oxidoreductase n=1 Tax=Commensalibacter sp. Nvir TaxID=3069817 RepID=UPI002D690C01|nr:NADP-dependent 3-hydroxy acid dehydrogenase YdfG [Commensalibacter sp. Nvir]